MGVIDEQKIEGVIGAAFFNEFVDEGVGGAIVSLGVDEGKVWVQTLDPGGVHELHVSVDG